MRTYRTYLGPPTDRPDGLRRKLPLKLVMAHFRPGVNPMPHHVWPDGSSRTSSKFRRKAVSALNRHDRWVSGAPRYPTLHLQSSQIWRCQALISLSLYNRAKTRYTSMSNKNMLTTGRYLGPA